MCSSRSSRRCEAKGNERRNRCQKPDRQRGLLMKHALPHGRASDTKSMKRIIAQVKKELLQLWRDRLTLALALVLPVLLLLLLSKATSLSVRDIPVVVQDLDKTPISRMYLESVSASLSFKLSALPTDSSPEELLQTNQARGALIIPPNFERDLRRGQNAEVQWLIDATDANTANIMRGKAAAITQAFTTQIRPASMQPAIRSR